MPRILCLAAMLGALPFVAVPSSAGTADIEAGRRQSEACAECHGADGNSTAPTIPALAGQPPLYVYYQLVQFREGRRKDPQMSPYATNLSDAEMQDLAAYYAAQQPTPTERGEPDPDKAAAAQHAIEKHHCAYCHAPGLVGQDHIPRLAGQHSAYLLKQLRGFKAQTSADLDGSMTTVAQALSAEEIEALAHYIAHLPLTASRPRR